MTDTTIIAQFVDISRFEDGSEDKIALQKLAEAAVVKEIGLITAIKPVKVQVALKHGETAQSFSFSRMLTLTRLILQLESGQIDLINLCFLVVDANIA